MRWNERNVGEVVYRLNHGGFSSGCNPKAFVKYGVRTPGRKPSLSSRKYLIVLIKERIGIILRNCGQKFGIRTKFRIGYKVNFRVVWSEM